MIIAIHFWKDYTGFNKQGKDMIIMAEICWQIDFEAKQPIYLQIYEQLKR